MDSVEIALKNLTPSERYAYIRALVEVQRIGNPQEFCRYMDALPRAVSEAVAKTIESVEREKLRRRKQAERVERDASIRDDAMKILQTLLVARPDWRYSELVSESLKMAQQLHDAT